MSGRDPRFPSGWWFAPVVVIAIVTYAYLGYVYGHEWGWW